MKKDYWEVSDEKIVEETGKKITDWIKILEEFNAAGKKSNDVVTYLQQEFGVPSRYWARTLITIYMRQKE